ncbi:MAG TPA: hypothetical protein VF545_05820 [Thermoleophilaceae bacterium]
MPLLGLVVGVCAIVGAIALSNVASDTGKRACVEAAQAKYPAVAVTAFVTKDRSSSGPLKVSFVKERARAVDKCD